MRASESGRPKRSVRVAERVKGELMDMLIRGVVRDPAVTGCFVSDVQVTDDLQHARVYIRALASDAAGPAEASEAVRRDAVAALNRAAGFIRRELSPRLKLKYLPDLRFFWDENLDRAMRVEELLQEIAEQGPGDEGEA